MQVATNMSGAGLGTFTEGPVDGGCKSGADFICGPRGGILSCRPCDFSQLDAFKQLQKTANQLVVGLGLDKSPAIIVGADTCEGGDLLAIDGRVGPCTRRTISKIVRVAGPTLMKPTDPILGLAKFKPNSEYIAHVIPELLAYMDQLVAISKAPRNVPAPAQQPIKRVTAPGSVPVVVAPNGKTVPASARTGKSKYGWTLGIFGALAAVGLVGTGVYYYKSENA